MKKRRVIAYVTVFLVFILINVVAWNSTAFCDWYIRSVFPVWGRTYGWITGRFPFSVGEFMIVTGLVLMVIAVVLGIVTVFFLSLAKYSWASQKLRKISKIYYKILANIALGIFMVMTLNCFVLYHASTFTEKYFDISQESNYTVEEVAMIRDFVVMKCNELSIQVERDEKGNIIYSGDMQQEAIEAMKSMGDDYDQLSGYYSRPKAIFFSEFLSQQHMQGYYFPFSLEANYNDKMNILLKPATMCHELAHWKGFIYEDEANLIGYLACINSDDLFFQYSGYLSVLNYIDNDFYEALHRNKQEYKKYETISAQVRKDNIFLTEEDWKDVEVKAVIKTETVDKLTDEFLQKTLVMNGIEDGMQSYCRVVGLLLDYYSKCQSDTLPAMVSTQ